MECGPALREELSIVFCLGPGQYSGLSSGGTRIFSWLHRWLEAPLVCLQQGCGFGNVGTWDTGDGSVFTSFDT